MADPSTTAAARERGWWIDSLDRDEQGDYDVRVQFLDGHAILLHLLPSNNLDVVIADAVQAHLDGDRRWTARSDRGNG